MNKPIYDAIKDITEDGAYLVQENGVVNYSERWAYGYIVPLRDLRTSDFKRGTLFAVINNGDEREYRFANHVDDLQTAKRVARDANTDAMFDLRMQRWDKS